MKIVSIGNSFSVNMQRFAHRVAAAAGQDLTVVNAFHGGCTMLMHARFYREEAPAYRHDKNGGILYRDVTLQSILSSDEFDLVTLQPGTGEWREVGRVPDNEPYIYELIEAAKRFQPRAELVYNHYWADADDCTRPVFTEFFSSSREKMRAWWQGYADRAAAIPEIGYVNPCGQAVDNAYSLFQSRLYKDGYHLSPVGEYLQALVWTEFFTGAEPCDFVPEEVAPMLTADEAVALRKAAHEAVLSAKITPAKRN